MTKVEELKQAVADLEADLQALGEAKRELDSWYDHDRTRRDGSTRQDAMHEKSGEDARHAVYVAERKVESQKRVIASLANAC